jgi:hypothetical protein
MTKEWWGKPHPTLYIMGQKQNNRNTSKIKIKSVFYWIPAFAGWTKPLNDWSCIQGKNGL